MKIHKKITPKQLITHFIERRRCLDEKFRKSDLENIQIEINCTTEKKEVIESKA